MNVRSARENEIDQLARIWYDGWRDAHERILPEELARDRTLESFKVRLREALANVRVAGPPEEPAGFCILKDDELYQLYVAERGVEKAWLACAIGNDRAARFYERSGWRRVGNMISVLLTAEGPFPLEVWRYEKILARPA